MIGFTIIYFAMGIVAVLQAAGVIREREWFDRALMPLLILGVISIAIELFI